MSRKVVIIGGGIGGLSTAYYLNKAGAAVTVVDRGHLDNCASIGNAGFLSMYEKSPMAYPGVFLDTFRAFLKNRSPMVVNSIFDRQLARWGYQFAKAASRPRYERTLALLEHFGEEVFNFYQELTDVDKVEVEYNRKGFVLIYTDKNTFHKKLKTIPENSENYQIFNTADLSENFPLLRANSVAGGILLKRNGHLNPGKVVSGLHALLESRGVTFRLGEEVKKIETEGDSVTRIISSVESYEADDFVLASGADLALSKQLKRDLVITPGRGYSISFPMESALRPKLPGLFCDIYTAITPRETDVRITGKIEFGKVKKSPKEQVDSLVSILKNYTSDFTIENGTIWSGDRPLTGNDMPYIGRDQRYANFSYVMGLGHTGINIGPICGRIVSELLMHGMRNVDHKDVLNFSQFYQG